MSLRPGGMHVRFTIEIPESMLPRDSPDRTERGYVDDKGQRWTHVPWVGVRKDPPSPFLEPPGTD